MKIAEYNQMYKHLIRPSDQNERIKKYFEKIGWQINFAGINSGRYFVEAKRK